MLQHLRRLFTQSVVYGLAETISRGTGFLLGFMYNRALDPAELGYRSAIYTVVAFVAVFYTLGLDTAFLRYFLDDAYKERKKELFSSAFYFSLAVGLGILASFWFSSSSVSLLMTDNELSSPYITRLLFFILILDTIVIFPTLVLRAENRFIYYSVVSFSRFFLFIGVNVILVWILGRGLKGVFEANLIVVSAVAVLLLPVILRYLRPVISFKALKVLFAFGIPTIFSLLCMKVIDFADKQMILRLIETDAAEALGGYNNAYQLGMVGIVVFVNSFRLAWHPFYLSMRDSAEQMGRFFARVTTFYIVFIGMAFLGIVLFRSEIFCFYAPKFPESLSLIVPVVSFSYIFFGLYIIMLAGVFIKEKTKYLPLVTFIAALINVGLNFYFIPAFGVIGAAYTTVLSYLVMALAMYMVSSRIYRVPYEYRRLAYAVAVTGLPIILHELYSPESLVFSIPYRALLILIPVAAYVFGPFLYEDERVFVRGKLNV